MEDAPAFDLLGTVARAVALAAIVVMTGAAVFFWGVLRRRAAGGGAPGNRAGTLVARAGTWAAAVLLIDAPVRLYAQARGLLPPDEPVAPMMLNVLHTTWGRGWLVQTAAAFGVLAGMLMVRRGLPRGWGVALAACIALTLSPALMGHAVAAEHLLAVSLAADWIHVTMAGAWLGGVAMLAMLAFASADENVQGSSPVAESARLIELFHPVALTASATLLATGVISLLLRVEHLADLLSSLYGAVLAAKLAIALGVAGMGYHHSRRGAELVRRGGTRAISRTLAVEVLLAATVIAATAVLVGTSPPMAM